MNTPAKITPQHGGEVEKFDPRKTAAKDGFLDAIRNQAQRLRDWPMLEQAVDEQVSEQERFVAWWDEHVRKKGERTNVADPRHLTVEQVEQLTGITKDQAHKWRKALKDRAKYRAKLFGAAWQKAMMEAAAEHNHRAQGTGENEWYTPDEYLTAAREVLGDFDLDPASSETAQEKVRAGKFFTIKTNGLLHDWHGRVWLNPPYAQPHIAHFVSKMVAERRAGRVTAAIMLTHNYTDTAWFHEAASVADAICYTRGRIKFYDADGETCAPTQGQAFFYFGDDVATFAERFSAIGFIALPWHGEA